MSSAEEFRAFAKECLDWAKTARSDPERSIFADMARTWIDAAARLEAGPVAIEPVAAEFPASDRSDGGGAPPPATGNATSH
jgi:hypothetical protein